MDSSPKLLFAMALLTCAQPILQHPIYKLTSELLKIYMSTDYSAPHIVSFKPPTPTQPSQAALEQGLSENVYFFALALFCMSMGANTLLYRGNFFSSGFKLYIGCLAKAFEILTGAPFPLYSYSAVVTMVLELVSGKPTPLGYRKSSDLTLRSRYCRFRSHSRSHP